ncbi:hypothetical protein L208DRAFT_1544813 [Tricholoma matsutake]|nr:hypothetical protein L208DRAFT_1544813 [Tricholoma matsutake 945]
MGSARPLVLIAIAWREGAGEADNAETEARSKKRKTINEKGCSKGQNRFRGQAAEVIQLLKERGYSCHTNVK